MDIFSKVKRFLSNLFRKEVKSVYDLRKGEIIERIEDVKKRVKHELPDSAVYWSFEDLINYILSPLLRLDYIPFEEQIELLMVDKENYDNKKI